MEDKKSEPMSTSDCLGLVVILVTIIPLLLWRGALLAYGWNNFVYPNVGVSLTTVQGAGICVLMRILQTQSSPTETDNWKWLGKQVMLLIIISLVLLALVSLNSYNGGIL